MREYASSGVESVLVSLFPDVQERRKCLTIFLESLHQANDCGKGKWGAYYTNDRVRLLVGHFVVLTLVKGRVWAALDQQSLEESPDGRRRLDRSENWQWDEKEYPQYVKVPSRNGYSTPALSGIDPDIWPEVQKFHFAFIGNAARRFQRLPKSSQRKHMPDLLEFLAAELGKPVPNPVYDTLVEEAPSSRLPEEVPDNLRYLEGDKVAVMVNAYERSPAARRKCIEHYGEQCVVCGFDFSKAYGDIGKGIIHVHHLRRLADIGEGYEVDPEQDLRPVCPNCHAVIHSRTPPYTIKEVKEMVERRRR